MKAVPGRPPKLKSCPKCGCEEYVIRLRVSGTIEEAHRFDEEPADNTEMWDHVRLVPFKTIRCRNCRTELSRDKLPATARIS